MNDGPMTSLQRCIRAREELELETGQQPTLTAIGHRVGLTHERVRQLFKRAGLPTAPVRGVLLARAAARKAEQEERRASRARASQEQREALLRAHRRGLTQEQIAAEVGLSRTRVGNVLRLAGVMSDRTWTRQDIERIAEMRDQNVTWRAIAEELGTSPDAAHNAFRRLRGTVAR